MSRLENQSPPPSVESQEFQHELARKPPSFAREFATFLRARKKWWLLPIVLFFLALALFSFLSGTGLAPFIYTLF